MGSTDDWGYGGGYDDQYYKGDGCDPSLAMTDTFTYSSLGEHGEGGFDFGYDNNDSYGYDSYSSGLPDYSDLGGYGPGDHVASKQQFHETMGQRNWRDTSQPSVFEINPSLPTPETQFQNINFDDYSDDQALDFSGFPLYPEDSKREEERLKEQKRREEEAKKAEEERIMREKQQEKDRIVWEWKHCNIAPISIPKKESFEFLEVTGSGLKLLSDLRNYYFDFEARPGRLSSSQSFGVAVITRWLSLDGEPPKGPYPFQEQFPITPKASHPNKVLGHVGEVHIPSESKMQTVIVLDPPEISFNKESLVLVRFLSSISNYFFLDLNYTERKWDKLTNPTEKLLNAVVESRGSKVDIKKENPFPNLHLSIHGLSKPSESKGTSMDFFDHRFWRDSGLAALIADKYCQVEERNKEDGRIYDQRNGSYGPFLKMSVVPEDIPTEFYDQLIWNACTSATNHLEPLKLTHRENRVIHSCRHYHEFVSLCLQRCTSSPEKYVFSPPSDAKPPPTMKDPSKFRFTEEKKGGELSIYEQIEKDVVKGEMEMRVEVLVQEYFNAFYWLLPLKDEKLQLVDEFIQRDICNKLKGDESWHDIEISQFFPSFYASLSKMTSLRELNETKKTTLVAPLEEAAKVSPSLTMASNFVQVRTDIDEYQKMTLRYAKKQFSLLERAPDGIECYRDIINQTYNKYYPGLEKKQRDLQKVEDDRKAEEAKKKTEEQLKRKMAWDRITCRRKRLEQVFKHFWNPFYFAEKIPKQISAERERQWQTKGGKSLWEGAKNGSNGESGGHGTHGNHGQKGLNGGHGRDGGDGARAGACLNLEGNWVELFVTHKNDTFEKTGSVEMQGKAIQKDGDNARAGYDPLSFSVAPSKNEYLRLDFGGGDGGHGGNGGNGGNGGKGTTGNFSFGQMGAGPGSDGGRGGNGGEGGSAGTGGNGARGVFVDVVTDDVRLLSGMLLHTKGGSRGDCGLRGEKGSEGQGGRGGVGAHGGRGKAPASSGRGGSNGSPGMAGMNKKVGELGGSGQVRYVVVEKGQGDLGNRKIVDCGLMPPSGQVCGWSVRVADDDGILEPGEELFLHDVEVFNDGKDLPMLTLPADSDVHVTFPNGGMELQDPKARHYIADPVEPGDSRKVKVEIGLKVPIPPAPTKPGPFIYHPELVGQVGMLCWESTASPYLQMLEVRWPVVMESMKCPSQLSRGEREMLCFSVKNLCKRDIAKGLMCYRVVLKTQGLVKIVGEAEAHIDAIGVGETKNFEIGIEVEDSAPLFKRASYHVELWYKNRMIEFATFQTRITPIYDPKASTDIVLFSNKHQSYGEMCMWFRLLSSFVLSVQFWDLEKYGGLSAKAQADAGVKPHSLDWADGNNHGKLLLLPLNSQRDLATLEGGNFIDHFQGKKNPDEGACLFTGVESAHVVKSIFRTSKASWEVSALPLKFQLRPKKIAEKKASLAKKYNNANPQFFHMVEIHPIESFKTKQQYKDLVDAGTIVPPTTKGKEKRLTGYALIYRSPFARNVRAITIPSFRSFSQTDSFFNFLNQPNVEKELGTDLNFPGSSDFCSLVHSLVFSLSMTTKLRIADLWRGQPQPQLKKKEKEAPPYFQPPDVTPLTMKRLERVKKGGKIKSKKVTREFTYNALDVVCTSILGELQLERFGVKLVKTSGLQTMVMAKAKMKKGLSEFPVDMFPSTNEFLEFVRKEPKIGLHTSLALRLYDILKKVSWKAPPQLSWQYHKIFEARFHDCKVAVRGESGRFTKSDAMTKTMKFRDSLHVRKVELWDENNLGKKSSGRIVCQLMYQDAKFSKQMQNTNAFDLSGLDAEEEAVKEKDKKKDKNNEEEEEEGSEMEEESEDEYCLENEYDETFDFDGAEDSEEEEIVPIYCVKPTALLFETEIIPPAKEVMEANYAIMPKEVFYHPLSYGFGMGNFPDPPNYTRPFHGPPWIL